MSPPQRWDAHPAAARILRAAVRMLPVLAAAAAGLGLAGLLHPSTRPQQLLVLAGVLPVSATTALLTERAVRRLLPLAALLELTLVFPDRTPSRFRVAGTKGDLHDLRERARLDGADAVAAEEIVSLAVAFQQHDGEMRGHCDRVGVYVDLLGEEISLADDDRERLRWAGLLHDIGKLTVPTTVLEKPGALDPDEWELIRRHPTEGMRIVHDLLPWLGGWSGAIGGHHENHDGTGYPSGIGGHRIHLGGRITHVADAFEAMTAARAYKQPMGVPDARQELVRRAGTQFDPAVVRAFLNISIGRLRRAVGAYSTLAALPVIGKPLVVVQGVTERLGRRATEAAAGAAAAVAITAATVVPSPSSSVAAGPPPPAATAIAAPETAVLGVVATPSPSPEPVDAARRLPSPLGTIARATPTPRSMSARPPQPSPAPTPPPSPAATPSPSPAPPGGICIGLEPVVELCVRL